MCGCTCAKHSVKYRICYVLHKITFYSFCTSHTHMVSSCEVHRHKRDGKDAQLLLSIGHLTVSQSDPVRNTYNFAIHCTQTCL